MKFLHYSPSGVSITLDEVKQQFVTEFFLQPKSEQQSIAKWKDIKHMVGETGWDYAQRFLDLMGHLPYMISITQGERGTRREYVVPWSS